jgi:hypothetical protein
MSLFYIEYGCSICTEHLIVSAKDMGAAYEFAYQEAQNIYYSYDCNYPDVEDYEDDMSEDDIAELMHQDMEQDIHYFAEIYDAENEDHAMTMREQDNKPHEI